MNETAALVRLHLGHNGLWIQHANETVAVNKAPPKKLKFIYADSEAGSNHTKQFRQRKAKGNSEPFAVFKKNGK